MKQPPILPAEKPTARQTPTTQSRRSSGLASLLENKLAVLGTLFLVTGALGIPLLWMSSKFSTHERWLWAIINSVYTAALIWFVIIICLWSWRQISAI